MSLFPPERPLAQAPSRGDPRLLPWLTRADLGLLKNFELGSSVTVAASDLAGAVLRPMLAQRVRHVFACGLALHPQLHLLQLPGEQQQRHFADDVALLSEPLAGPINPMAELLAGEIVTNLAEHILDLAVSGLGTTLLAGSFLLTDASTVGLDNNLAMLAASARYFHEEGVADGTDGSESAVQERQLFATISLDCRVLRHAGFINEVLEAHIEAAGAVSGFWVQVANFGSKPKPADVRILSDFLYELDRRTEKPVVPDRVGQLGLGYLACGLPYCIGSGAPEYLRFPPTVALMKDGEKPTGFSLVAYHAPSLRNFVAQGKHAGRALRAFANAPCDCGFHDAGAPPSGNKVKKLHCFHCRLAQSAAVVVGTPAENVAAFLALLASAEQESRAIDGDLRIYAALRETLPHDAASDVATG
jgi:hypothetical protein